MKTGKAKKGTEEESVTLETVFQEFISNMYWAEKHLMKLTERLAAAANSEELQVAFTDHLNDTGLQVSRLEKCHEIGEIKPGLKDIGSIEGLVKECDSVISRYEAGHVRDAALIAAAQCIEHFEIATYGTLRTMATALGKVQNAALLEECKDEEAEFDERLTRLSVSINQLAMEPA